MTSIEVNRGLLVKCRIAGKYTPPAALDQFHIPACAYGGGAFLSIEAGRTCTPSWKRNRYDRAK
jgi:hypothetical protein